MRLPVLLPGAAALVVLAGPVLAANQREWDKCQDVNNAANADLNIAACDRILNDPKETVRNKAAAYGNRCGLWTTKGEFDRGASDCNQAIRLDPKLARAYLNRGNAYRDKGDLDRAIADHSEAIRLNPKDGDAYLGRGNTYYDKGDYDRAIADYTEAIRLDPKYEYAYFNRGNSYRHKDDYDRAIADYTEAIRLDPKDKDPYNRRGLSHLYSGDLTKALADVSQASELDPKDAYCALWVDIVGQRNNLPSRLSQATAKIDMTAWPAPVIRLFLGQMTPAAVLAAADDPDATKKKGQVCEANFYSGELALRQGAKDEATRLFQLAASECPKTFIEWDSANHELKALGVAP